MISTATDRFDDDTPLATDLQRFAYLANNLVELLETAKYALERDREAAKVPNHFRFSPRSGHRLQG